MVMKSGAAPTEPAYALTDAPLVGERRLRAMNTDVLLLVRDPERAGLLAEAADVFVRLEERLSRFRTDSELSALNRRAGSRTRVSPELFEVLELAAEMQRRTGGLFEPGILGALEAAGYDRSFERVAAESSEGPAAAGPRRSIAEMTLHRESTSVTTPAGLRLDLGGIGKGYAVDRAARVLAPTGDFLIDAGGDVRACGDGPDGDGWPVAVAGPARGSEDVALLRLRDEALATSTTAVRRWRRGARWLNHLIDPRTGEPADGGVVSASVLAPTTVEAEVLAKAALLMGPREGVRFLEARGRAGLVVLDDGTLLVSGTWNQRQESEFTRSGKGRVE
jgi:thiamine biosynthesis lipoprotein